MKPHMNYRKNTWSILRSTAVASAFATGCLAMAPTASAQNFPVSCFDTPEKMDIFVAGEKAGELQIDAMWNSIGNDCDRLPELMGGFIQQVGLLMEAGTQQNLPMTVLCRLTGQINGVTIAWSRMVDSCVALQGASSQAKSPSSSK